MALGIFDIVFKVSGAGDAVQGLKALPKPTDLAEVLYSASQQDQAGLEQVVHCADHGQRSPILQHGASLNLGQAMQDERVPGLRLAQLQRVEAIEVILKRLCQ